jgi:hypothetical protein
MRESSNIKVIGCSGYARCGKDTFVNIAKDILVKNNYTPLRVAFADKLKVEVGEMLADCGFATPSNAEDEEQKRRIRPLYVWWGCQRRYESEGQLYWVNAVDDQLKAIVADMTHNGMSDERIVAMVADVRFVNEAMWIHNQWGGKVIHLKRYKLAFDKVLKDRKEYDPAPNEEEAKNDPLVQDIADFHIEWESRRKYTPGAAVTDLYLRSIVLKTLNDMGIFTETLSL